MTPEQEEEARHFAAGVGQCDCDHAPCAHDKVGALMGHVLRSLDASRALCEDANDRRADVERDAAELRADHIEALVFLADIVRAFGLPDSTLGPQLVTHAREHVETTFALRGIAHATLDAVLSLAKVGGVEGTPEQVEAYCNATAALECMLAALPGAPVKVARGTVTSVTVVADESRVIVSIPTEAAVRLLMSTSCKATVVIDGAPKEEPWSALV